MASFSSLRDFNLSIPCGYPIERLAFLDPFPRLIERAFSFIDADSGLSSPDRLTRLLGWLPLWTNDYLDSARLAAPCIPDALDTANGINKAVLTAAIVAPFQRVRVAVIARYPVSSVIDVMLNATLEQLPKVLDAAAVHPAMLRHVVDTAHAVSHHREYMRNYMREYKRRPEVRAKMRALRGLPPVPVTLADVKAARIPRSVVESELDRLSGRILEMEEQRQAAAIAVQEAETAYRATQDPKYLTESQKHLRQYRGLPAAIATMRKRLDALLATVSSDDGG